MKTTTLSQTNLQSKKWLALAVLCTAQFMVIMDTSIIGVALPAIQKSLNYTPSELQWIFNAYVIVFGGILLLGGKLSDLFGPKKIFMWGFSILTIASLLTGLSWSETSMNLGRAAQGLGAALIAPSALTLLMTIFTDPKELGKAFGFWGAAAAAGGSAGVFLGGLLTEYLSWRWTFFINLPLGIIVMFAGSSLLIKGNRLKHKIDYIGSILITLVITLLVYTLIMVEKNGWTSTVTLLLFGLTSLLFLVFVLVQKKSKTPILPLSIFKVPNLTAGNIIMLLMAGSWIPLWFYLNLYLQQTLEYSAFYSGLALLPMTIAIMILMVGVTGKLIAKFGFKSTLVTGLLALTGSLIWFSFVPVNGDFLNNVLGASLLGAVGMSLAYIPGTMASMSGAKPEETGLASGIANTTYQVGSAIGLAIVVVLAVSTTSQEIANGAINKEALNIGFQTAFKAAAGISGISVLVAIIGIKKIK
ncbi:MAG: MFS transporter [Bacteroidota bacterium]|nr:MFS transporter [Bacteroidota bacterium]MDP3145950.1 MFS transporter [Bacteroidota bacterium]MDP3558585.1 MFS transporter [Bacteroidota bacterium]